MPTKKVSGFTSVLVCVLLLLSSCSVNQKIGKKVKSTFLKNKNLSNAHIGISIYDPASNKFLYNYQGESFFIPASNTKILTCYAALKYLGDSIAGIRYREDDTAVYLFPTGDPSFLHKDFHSHPVHDFFKRTTKSVYITDQSWKTEALGNGWVWNDYNSSYMTERSPLPVYGNNIRWIQERTAEENKDSMAFDQSLSIYSLPEVNWKVRFNTDLSKSRFFVQRKKNENVYEITQGTEKKKEQQVPFVTNGLLAAVELLRDTINKQIAITLIPGSYKPFNNPAIKTIYSQPTDSILKIMMQQSDNFFAEQLLLMAANEKYGFMDEDSIINFIVETVFNHFPQKPRWVDGSGLSRYNLLSPKQFITLLNTMKNEFPLEQLKTIFPTPGQGTLIDYSKSDSGFVYAKTGTLSGVVALSGFLYTKKNKLLIFSFLVNNHRTTATEVRKNLQQLADFVRNIY